MATASTDLQAWATPPRERCGLASCDLCRADEPEAIITRRPPVRAAEARPVRVEVAPEVDTAELVFASAPWCY